MKTTLSSIYVNTGMPALRLEEETLSDKSKVYSIVIGDNEVACVCDTRAVKSFTEIAVALRAASVNSIVVL